MKSWHLAAVATVAFLCIAAPVSAAEVELVQTIVLKGKAGGLDHVAIDAKRDRLFLANKVNNTLDIIDLKTGKLLEQKSNQTAIQGVCYAPDIDLLFVALGTNGLCNVFDGEKYTIKKTFNLKDDADNIRYNPATHLVYVAHADKMLAVIEAKDAKTVEKKADIKLPDTAESFELETKRPLMYLNAPGAAVVAVIDTEKNEVTKRYPVKMSKGGHPLALDEANKRIYVGCRGDAKDKPMVVVLDTESGKEIGGVEIPGGIDDLWLDAKRKRLYASCGDGFLVVLKQADADKLEIVDKIETAKGAKTCCYAADTGRLYLAVPRQEGKEGPEIRIYQVK
jgi:DNA-binding beta-propeller fold protein YncE